jgi:hypothetical protein
MCIGPDEKASLFLAEHDRYFHYRAIIVLYWSRTNDSPDLVWSTYGSRLHKAYALGLSSLEYRLRDHFQSLTLVFWFLDSHKRQTHCGIT